MKRILSVVIAALVAVAASPAFASGPVHPPKVMVVGDSLAREAQATVEAAFAADTTFELRYRATVGHAPCDFIKTIGTAAGFDVILIELAGNSQTACMKDAAGHFLVVGSQAWKDKYRADMNTLFALTVTQPGLRLIIISPPPFAPPALETLYTDVFPLLRADAAASYPSVSFTDGPRLSVADGAGAFAQQLPCLVSEDAADGCAAGLITVRAPDGVHFCPNGLHNQATPCTLPYSSGAYRFGVAIVDAINAARPF